MSDIPTPRTDALLDTPMFRDSLRGWKQALIDHARTLERELAEAKAALLDARAHIGPTPSRERIKEAHSFFSRDQAMQDYGGGGGQYADGHRAYHQGYGDPSDEGCYICALSFLLDAAERELAREREDARRYRWLRDVADSSKPGSEIEVDDWSFVRWPSEQPGHIKGARLDAAIDAALSAPGGATGTEPSP